MEQEPQDFENRLDLSALHESIQRIREQFSTILIGQTAQIDMLLCALLSNGHVLIEGVPGLAKTLMSRTLAQCINARFSRIQFTPDLMPTDVLGTTIFNPKSQEFSYHKGPVFSNIVLIDEINRAPAKTQAALFEVMEERTVTNSGTTWRMEEPFFVMATQNPVEHEGTYRLPEAQVDRFLFKLEIGYPELEEEVRILEAHHSRPAFQALEKLEPAITKEAVLEARQLITKVHVEKPLMEYITSIVAGTRNHKSISLGASPRASIAILTGAKAFAAIQGRDFITPEDVRYILLPALRHRIVLSAEAEMEGRKTDRVINSIADTVDVPR